MTPTNNFAVRTQLLETDDSGTQQTLKMSGRKREMFGGDKKKVLRIQSYGMSSHAPEKSQAVTTTMGGNPDQLMILGVEHPDSRPKNLEKGEVKVYEQWGGFVHMQEGKHIWKKDDAEIHVIKEGGIVHLNPPSAAALEADPSLTLGYEPEPKIILP